MNIISKAYCRIFQFCFHLALPILPYREPKIYKNVADIVKLLKKNKLKLEDVLVGTMDENSQFIYQKKEVK